MQSPGGPPPPGHPGFPSFLVDTSQSVPINLSTSSPQSVEEFLNALGLPDYVPLFLSHGFDRIQSLYDIQEADMAMLGIDRGHSRIIQSELLNLRLTGSLSQTARTDTTANPWLPGYFALEAGNEPTYQSFRPTQPYASTSQLQPSPQQMFHPNLHYGSSASQAQHAVQQAAAAQQAVQQAAAAQQAVQQVSVNPSFPRPGQDLQQQQQQPPAEQYYFQANPPYASTSTITGSTDLLDYKTNQPVSSSSPSTTASTSSQLSQTMAQDASGSSPPTSTPTSTTTPTPTKRKYRRRPKADENAPVKPLSAYLVFSNELREELKGISFADLTKTAAERWKNMPDDERELREEDAANKKKQFVKDLADYKLTPQYEAYQRYVTEFNAAHRPEE